jgi:hypothetical protein
MVVGFLPSAVFSFFAYGVGYALLCLLFSGARFFLLFGFWFVVVGLWLFAFGVGLSLISCRSICTAPVRGGTHFLCGRKESKQRKRLTPPAFRCPPLAHPQSGPRTIWSPTHLTPVTQQSFAPASRFAPRRWAQLLVVGEAQFSLARCAHPALARGAQRSWACGAEHLFASQAHHSFVCRARYSLTSAATIGVSA